MIHDRVDHLQIARLRSRTIGHLRVEKRPGVKTPQLGGPVEAYAPVERDDDGEVVKKRETLRCMIVEVASEPGAWIVTYRAGHVEPGRFLRARPGAVKLTPDPDGGDPIPDGDADYTTSTASAARGEPECVPKDVQAEYAAQADTMNRMRQIVQRREAREARSLMSLHERLRELEGSRHTADITRELRAIRQRIERAERAA